MPDFLDVVQKRLEETNSKMDTPENLTALKQLENHYAYLLDLKQRLILRALRNKPVSVKHWR